MPTTTCLTSQCFKAVEKMNWKSKANHVNTKTKLHGCASRFGGQGSSHLPAPKSVQSWAGMWATTEHGSAWPVAGQSRAGDSRRLTLLQCCWHRSQYMDRLEGALQGQQCLRVPTGSSQCRQT